MRDDFKKVNSLLRSYLRANGLEEKFLERTLAEGWPKIVGPLFGRYTKTVRFKSGVVYIEMTSAMARNELMMKKTTILASLNEYLGEKSVRDIVIR